MTRVLLADDQALVRGGFRLILERDPAIEVVGEAADGEEAVALARSLRPDVVLMDIRMPVLDGLAATRRVTGDRAGAGVGLIGMRERVTACGGRLETGPTPDGYSVRARLPLVEADP